MVSAVKVELTNSNGNPRSYTCAAGTAISKLKLLTLTDPRTAAEVSDTPNAAGYAFGGIAAMEKSATNDTSTELTAWTSLIAGLRASGAITAGTQVKSVGMGEVKAMVAAEAGSASWVGRALETAADQEIIEVAVGQII